MTKKELSINIKWDEFEMGTCRIFVETLNQYIPTVFFQDHKPKPTVSNKMLQSVNDILNMDMNEFDRLEEILGTDVYNKSKIHEIHIDQENDKYDGVYSEVIMSTGANIQVSVIVKNAAFICVNDGTYFDTLVLNKTDSDVDVSKKGSIDKASREKILAMMLSS